MLDVFDSDAFNVISMTEAINTVPYTPMRLGQLGLFKPKPVTTTTVVIDYKGGVVSLIPSKARGTTGVKMPSKSRNARTIEIPFFPAEDELLADSIQGVRAFGKEDATETINEKLNEKLSDLRTAHEVTHEFLRVGALKGNVIDGDGSSSLLNIFSEFNVTQTVIDFDLDNATPGNVNAKCQAVQRAIQSALGGVAFTGILAICGDTFYDQLSGHEHVRNSFGSQNDAAAKFLLETQGVGYAAPRFSFGGIVWENYRGSVGDVDFVAAGDCHFIPLGVPGLFNQAFAPAPFIESVNTPGKPFYAKQERQKFDMGIDIHTNSSTITYCTRPDALVKGTNT